MELAIIGPTACGKSDIAIQIAKKTGGIILSLDSLSIYKEIDIASAKPTLSEREGVEHFGVDIIFPNENFNVTLFFDLYKKVHALANSKNVPLLVVGGTSFYLKSLLSGFSQKPKIDDKNRKEILKIIGEPEKAYEIIKLKDPKSALKIEKNDRYRIEKWYETYYETGEIPSSFLERTKQQPLIQELAIFEIEMDKDVLLERIKKRTAQMIEKGLIDEVARLEKKYTREPNCMKSIGIKEVMEYFDGSFDLPQMQEKIVINTAHLAKRQRTFNRTQFAKVNKKPLEKMGDEILKFLQKTDANR